MTWVYTDSELLTDRWSAVDFNGYALTAKISRVEWFNVDTGATYCLVSDGEWATGGRFHLLFKAPGSETAINVSRLLGPVTVDYEPETSIFPAGNYRKVRDGVVEFMGKMLPATNVYDFHEYEDVED